MWNVNYENPEKLHMSIGLGLIIASFILYLVSTVYFYDRLDSASENFYDTLLETTEEENISKSIISDYMEINDAKIKAMTRTYKSTVWISLIIGIVGIIIFKNGYTPYISKFKKNKKLTLL